MGGNMTGEQRRASSLMGHDGRTLSRLRKHYRGSTALSNRALFWGAPLVGAALLSAVPAAGNPTGGTVVGGAATISGEGTANVTVNQTTDRAIVTWDEFSIGVGETTEFIQLDADSIALNRVTGGAESQLLGTLTANGNVWIVNPNGVFFGVNAQVDVSGLLASTIDVLDADFLDGDSTFTFDIPGVADATVINEAGGPGNTNPASGISIADTGLGMLVAPGVENRGVIVANLGSVVLGGTETFTLDLMGDNLTLFQVGTAVTAPPAGLTEVVSNTGTVTADGGLVMLNANAVAALVGNSVNMSGVAQASTVSMTEGTVILSAGGGNISATGTVTADNLLVTAGGGSGTLNNAANNVDTIAANLLGALSYNDADGYTVGTVEGTAGVTADGVTLNLASGALTLSADVDPGAGAITGNATTVNVTSSAASIQDAVDAAATGATVSIAGDSYAESVSIGKELILDLGGTVQVASLSATEAIGLGGTLNTDGGALSFSQAVTLTADVSLDTDQTQDATDAGAVTFDSTVDGAFSLAIDATGFGTDTGGAVTLGGVGQTVAVADLSVSGASLTLNGAITTADGDVILRSATDLTIANAIDTQPGLTGVDSVIDIALDPGVDPDAADPAELIIAGTGSLNSDIVNLTADDMDIGGAVTATGAVTLAQSTAGRQINLAAEVAGRLSLTDAEIDQIGDASVLRIGNSDAGRINFSDNVTPDASVTTVALISGDSVVDSNNSGLIVENLRISAAGVELDGGNHDVTNLAANVVGDGNDFVYINEIGGFTVASVDGVDGIATQDASSDSGDISLGSAGTIVINQTVATGSDTVAATDGIDAAQSGSITITTTAGGDIVGGALGSLTTGTAEVSGIDAVAEADTATSGSITLVADGAIELAGPDALTTGNATVTDADASDTATTGTIDLSGTKVTSDGATGLVDVAMGVATATGGIEVSGVLDATTDGGTGLDGAILVTSSGDLILGGLTSNGGTIVAESTAGGVNATGAIAAGAADVTLRAQSGAVTQTGGSIVADGLGVDANTATLLSNVNDINNLAADIGGANADFEYAQSNAFDVATVSDGIGGSTVGITTQGGQVNLIAGTGILGLTDGVTSNDGAVSLSGVGVTQAAGSTVDAGGGVITVDANDGAIVMDGSLLTTSSDLATGAVRIVDGGQTTLGNITAASGLVVLGGSAAGDELGATTQSDTPTPATIVAASLAVNSSGSVTLDHDNEIGLLGDVARGGAFTLNDATGGLTVSGAVGDNASNVDITTAGGALIVTNSITATGNDVNLAGDGVQFGATGDVSVGSGNILVDGRGGTISTTVAGFDGTQLLSTGTIELVADDVGLVAGSTIGGNGLGDLAGLVIVRPSDANAGNDTIGLAGGVGSLQLDLTELSTIEAEDVRIGDTTVTDGIDIGNQLTSGALAATFSTDVLTLASAGGITGSSAIDLADGPVDRNLILRAAGDVVLDNAGNDFSNVAADIGGTLTLDNSDALTVTTLTDDIGTVAGVTAANGVQIDAGGLLSVASGGVATTNAVSGDINLTARNGGLSIGAGVDSAGGSVDISALGVGGITSTAAIEGATNVALDTVNGAISVDGTVDATNGTVTIAASGLNRTLSSTGAITGNGNVVLSTSSGNVTVGGAVDSVAGAVTVTANGAGSILQNTAAITAQNAIGLTATAGSVSIDGLVDSDGGAVTVAANGTSATLTTSAGVTANGNLSISTTDGSVTLGGAAQSETGMVDIAGNGNVTINGAVDALAGIVTVTASGAGATLTTAGDVTANGNLAMSTTDGSVTIGGAAQSQTGTVSIEANGLNRAFASTGAITGNGDVTLSTSNGDVTVGGAVDSVAGAVTVTANGAGSTLRNTAAITAQNAIGLTATAGNVAIDGLVDSDAGAVTVAANGTAATLTTSAGITANGDLSISTTDGSVTVGGAAQSETGTVNIAGNGAVAINGAVDALAGAATITASGAGATLTTSGDVTANGNLAMSTTDGNVSIGGAAQSQNGTVDIAANGSNRTLASTGAITGNGDVTLSTSSGDLTVGGAVDSIAGAVTVTANGAGSTLQNTAAITAENAIGLTATDGNVSIDGLVDSDAGMVTIAANGTAATLTTSADVIANGDLSMSTADGSVTIGGAARSETGTVNIAGNGIVAINGAVDALAGTVTVTASGAGATLTTSGDVTANGDLAMSTTDGNVAIGGAAQSQTGNVDITANGTSRTLTTSAAVTGNGDVTLATSNGALTINDAVQATTGTATLTAGGTGTTLSFGAGATASAGNTVALTADEMALGSVADGNSVTGTEITIVTSSSGRIIDIGDDFSTASDLDLDADELSTVSASVLRIGDSGPIVVSDPVSLVGSATTLALQTTSVVVTLETGLATGDGSIAVENLAIDNSAGSGVVLTGDNAVTNLAIDTGGSLQFNDADGFIIGSVDSVTGLTSGGTMALTAEGGTIEVASSTAVTSGNSLTIDTGVDGGSGNGGSFVTGGGSSVVATTGNVSIVADSVGLGGTLTASAAGATVTIANATADRTLGLGGGAGDLALDLTELSRISADTLEFGSSNAGELTVAGLTAGATGGFNTLQLVNGQGMSFTGDVNGSFDLSMNAGGDINFGDLADLNSTVSFGNIVPLGEVTFVTPGNVELGGSPLAGARYFAESFVVDIGGNMVSGQLNPTTTTFEPVNIGSIRVVNAASVNLFGSIAGDATQTAASQAEAVAVGGPDADWLFNGCVIGTVQCFNIPLVLPVTGLDLSLDDERLLREPLDEEDEEFEDLLSNTGNEELW